MHERESQNVMVRRAVQESAAQQKMTARVTEGLGKVAPTAPQSGANVLRAGIQKLGEAVLGN